MPRVSSLLREDYVKKIAVYRDRLAVQLPDKARPGSFGSASNHSATS